MKKFGVIILGLCITVLCACGKSGKNTDTQEITKSTTESVTESIVQVQEETTMSEEDIEKMSMEIDELMFSNIYFSLFVFVERNLPPVDTYDYDSGEYMYQVDTSMYRNYAEFEEYIRSVYVKETADTLLNAYPSEGKTKYLNVDGLLYLDTRYANLQAVYIDWYNYDFEIDYIEDKECGFTIYTTITEPGENSVTKEYSVSSKIVWDDGYWYLTEMLY